MSPSLLSPPAPPSDLPLSLSTHTHTQTGRWNRRERRASAEDAKGERFEPRVRRALGYLDGQARAVYARISPCKEAVSKSCIAYRPRKHCTLLQVQVEREKEKVGGREGDREGYEDDY